MKKGKSERHRCANTLYERENPKNLVFNYYIKETQKLSQKYHDNNKDVDFCLLQSIRNKDNVRDTIFNLAYFYDYNFKGNRDFIHIPNIANILDKCLKYPIMIANSEDSRKNKEIAGAAIIKIENNYSLKQNPYFPTCNEDVLTITSVLTRLYENEADRIHGIGKDLFKAAIGAAYYINQEKKTRLITEIDCRNFNSLNAFCKAIKELKAEGININAFIAGYYEIKYKENHNLVEAPTFILEVDFTGKKKMKDSFVEFNYEKCNKDNLFKELLSIIKCNTCEVKNFINKIDNKIITFTRIKPINALNVVLNVGNSADGNNREPAISLLEQVESKVI